MTRWRHALIALLAALIAALPAAAQKRIALVIGNGAYAQDGWYLKNPLNDAKLMASALGAVGFEVHPVYNATEEQMEGAFKAHGDRLAAAGEDAIGFVFFAGHGVQSNGLNYLIPVDANIITEADVWSDAPRMGNLLLNLQRAGNATNFIVLDACRSNQTLRSFRSGTQGLAKAGTVRGTLIAYATKPGAVAEDGGGQNSPYTAVLAALIREPGLSAESLFRNVATRVEERTSRRQQPWMESGLRGERDFCFAGCERVGSETLDFASAIASGEPGKLYAFLARYPETAYRGPVEGEIARLEAVSRARSGRARDAGAAEAAPEEEVRAGVSVPSTGKMGQFLGYASRPARAEASEPAGTPTAPPPRAGETWRETLLLRPGEGEKCGVASAVFSPDGRFILSDGKSETRASPAAHLFDRAGQARRTFTGHSWCITDVAFSPDGARIVTASADETARVWDATSGRELARLEGHGGVVTSAAFSPDGARIVTASRDDTARLWDAASARELTRLEGHGGVVTSAAFSPDGARIVTASADKTARIWDAASGRALARLEGHEGTVYSAAFSPDGARIVTAPRGNIVRVWDAKSGHELAQLEGHGAFVYSAEFSPDGTRIVTASWDNTARVWDASSGRELARLERQGDGVVSAAFSPDGRMIVAISWDGTVRVWELE